MFHKKSLGSTKNKLQKTCIYIYCKLSFFTKKLSIFIKRQIFINRCFIKKRKLFVKSLNLQFATYIYDFPFRRKQHR